MQVSLLQTSNWKASRHFYTLLFREIALYKKSAFSSSVVSFSFLTQMRWALREAIFLSSSLNNVAQKVTLGWGVVLQKRSGKLLPHWTRLVNDNDKSRPFSKGSFHLCHKWKRNDKRSDTFDQEGIASSVSLWNGNREEHIRCCLSQTVCDRQTAFWKIVILDNVIQLLDTINKSHISRKQMPRRKRKLHH